jgi:hypothetical protein
MAQTDRDAIRRFVRQWKREIAVDEEIHRQQEEKKRTENDITFMMALSLISFAVFILLFLLFIGFLHK